MVTVTAWGDDLVSPCSPAPVGLGLESFNERFTQGQTKLTVAPYFKPVNIVVENGVYYATIYVCGAMDDSDTAQKLVIWLASLKATDHVKLTVASLFLDVPPAGLLSVMGALLTTKATIDIQLNQIVVDALAYFYLAAKTITKGSAGALYVPSYVTQRSEDHSMSWKAMHDFYAYVVEEAVAKGRLTADEGERLKSGSHVIIPDDRF